MDTCRNFLSKTNEERVAAIKEKAMCWTCLGLGHRSAECSQKKKCSKQGCDIYHHSELHEVHAAGLTYHGISETNSSDSCLLLVMSIQIPDSIFKLNVMWDTASTLSLITFKRAKQLHLKGNEVDLTITKTGGTVEQIKSFSYKLPLKDKNGGVYWLVVYGLPKISLSSENINTMPNTQRMDDVSKTPFQFCGNDVHRPPGEIIGLDYAAVNPRMIHNSEHLVLYVNIFGKCIGGMHPNLKETAKKLVSHAYVNHCISESFFLNEALGVEYTPHCGSCKCGKCPFDGKQHSLREERELALIKQGLVLTGKKWVATYPYIKDPMELPNNAKVAYAMLCAMEKRLMKQPAIAKMYQNQMNEMVESKFARKLSQEEISNYKSPIHYIFIKRF